MNRQQIREWLNEHLKDLYPEPVDASISDGELLIMGRLPVDDEIAEEEARARVQEHREQTRPQRMELAQQLEQLTGLAVAWGVRCGQVTAYFSSRRVPVMTRLGRAEREVLDTLIRGGIAHNRSQALAWAVQAFALGRRDWLRQLREAADSLQDIRQQAVESDTPEEPLEIGGPDKPRATSGPVLPA